MMREGGMNVWAKDKEEKNQGPGQLNGITNE
jgi:hypothetical protein